MAVIFSKTSGVKGSPPQKSDKCWTPPLNEKIFFSCGRRRRFLGNYEFLRIFNRREFLKWSQSKLKCEIIKELRRLSTVQIPNFTIYRVRRKLKLLIKGSQCVACKSTPQIVHHVIMVKNGGPSRKENLVELCHSCHAEIHHWLRNQL